MCKGMEAMRTEYVLMAGESGHGNDPEIVSVVQIVGRLLCDVPRGFIWCSPF